MVRALTEVTEHSRFDINRKQLSFGYEPGDPGAEISGARTYIGYTVCSLQVKSIQDLVGLLPGIARGVVKLLRPFLGIAKGVLIALAVLVMSLRIRSRLREQTTQPCAPNNKHESTKYRHRYTAH